MEIADAAGVELESGCRSGRCGIDAVEIVSGHENLSAMAIDEEEALASVCGRGESCRLACMAEVTGPVVCRLRDS